MGWIKYLENLVVEKDHNDAGYVEGGEGRVDDEIWIVEHAEGGIARRSVIQSQDDGWADGGRNEPHESDGEPNSFMILVPGVFYWLSHCYVPAMQRNAMQRALNQFSY